ncbi:MAG: hypothetical protein U9O56_09365 [Campylobacterota bacterium]|nr:hypothetical protein [Campylobacterota bacterium]
MKEAIDSIFDNVKYWLEKNQLLQAINPDYYYNKHIMLRLLGVTSVSVSDKNEAKRSMWNHHIENNNMGDDILKNINPAILKDFDFAKRAIEKYNRSYIYIAPELKASEDLAMTAALKERYDEKYYKEPILQYMPKKFQLDGDIALAATTRNIENLKYAIHLRSNKYFILDFIKFNDDVKLKRKILEYINPDLLQDKRFVSQLGCFDDLCENFTNDTEFVVHSVSNDISILKKTKLFDESILKAALQSDGFYTNREFVLADIFRYIEKFNHSYEELDSKIKDKSLLAKLFWEFGETVSDEFI